MDRKTDRGKLGARRFRSAALAVTALSAVATAYVSAAPAGAAPRHSTAGTRQIVYAPWNSNGTLAPWVKVGQRLKGSCWTGSIASPSPLAWRCMSSNYIQDPCVSATDAANTSKVVCFATPWQSATLLTLTKKLPLAYGNKGGKGLTWALALANGDRCVVGTGANSILHGVIMDYYCTSGALGGGLSTKAAEWTIQYKKKGTTTLKLTDVTTAWTIKQ
jgi:hypothetical protein